MKTVRFKKRKVSPLAKRMRRGFRGYPVATITHYGPDDTLATKIAVGIVTSDDDEDPVMRLLFAREGDIRDDPSSKRKSRNTSWLRIPNP